MMKARTRVETEKGKLTVHVDTEAGAVYLALRSGVVAETRIAQEWPIVAVDYDSRGRALGIEAAGFGAVRLGAIFKIAKVKPSARALAGTTVSIQPFAAAVSA